MMNTASSPLDPYHASIPHNGDPNYATLPMQPFYVDSYAPHPAARGAIMDQMPMSDGLAPLAPVTAGAQQTAVADLQPHSFVENGRKYELKVVQQPQRARMCGFGDKDRRPITPPPCVHLIITDVVSGKEVDCNEIDHGMFVLNVDLWNEAGTQEVNLIRNSQASPSISSTSMAAYTDVAQTAAAYTNNANALRSDPSAPPFKFDPSTNQGSPFQTQAQASYSPYPGPPPANTYSQSPSQPSYGEVPYQQGFSQSQMMNTAGFPQNGYPAGVPIYYTAGAGIHTQVPGVQPGMDYGLVSQPLMGTPSGLNPYDNIPYQANDQEPQRMQMSQSHPGGMFTRNLIGSLAASAFRLTDPNDRIGIWFVLQDLSVRTEGTFRLRFSFVNVGAPGGPSTPTADPNSMYIPSGLINTGRAHVLASCFSDSFIVYSAKRFPGVVESTDLSKCFATQGIKIPIRKDGPGGKGSKDREEYEED